jgi:PrcB C-terminal
MSLPFSTMERTWYGPELPVSPSKGTRMLHRILSVGVVSAAVAVSACESPSAPSLAQRRFESLLLETPWTLGAARDSVFRAAPLPLYLTSTGFCCRGLRVASTPNEWTALWDTVVIRISPPASPPAVDFATEMVVAALHGSAPSGGYSISIRHVTRLRDTTFVLAEATRPGRDCGTGQVVSSPIDVRVVPQAPPPTVLLVEQRVRDCRTGTSQPDW